MHTIEGKIVTREGIKHARVEWDNAGVITHISEPTGEADIVYKEELIFPGFIDLHVHAREDSGHTQDYKETFISAGEAAIHGGVVAFVEMPNNPVPPIDDASYDAKNILAQKSAVQILLYAGIGPKTEPLSKKVPYKVFMGPSVGDLFFTSLEDLEKVIARYEGQHISFHCEDPKILDAHIDEITHESKRPKEAEISAVDFAIMLIEKYNLTAKICHASTVEGVKKIIEAKKHGLKITTEVTPHHLYFDETMYEHAHDSIDDRNMLQVNPPIRQTKEDRLAMIGYLKNGEIDYLATDHAPHALHEKDKGISGIPHLDTYGPFTSWLMKEHGFTAEEIARACAENPGNFVNNFLQTQYGKIVDGYAASFTVIDMNTPITITKEKLKTKSGWSPFEGVTFPGSVTATIIKGKVYTHQ